TRLEHLRTDARDWCGLDEHALGELVLALEAPIRAAAALLELDVSDHPPHAEILAAARDAESRPCVDPAPAGGPADLGDAAAFERWLARELRARLDGEGARPLGLLLCELGELAAPPKEGARAERERALAACLATRSALTARLAPSRWAVLV